MIFGVRRRVGNLVGSRWKESVPDLWETPTQNPGRGRPIFDLGPQYGRPPVTDTVAYEVASGSVETLTETRGVGRRRVCSPSGTRVVGAPVVPSEPGDGSSETPSTREVGWWRRSGPGVTVPTRRSREVESLTGTVRRGWDVGERIRTFDPW